MAVHLTPSVPCSGEFGFFREFSGVSGLREEALRAAYPDGSSVGDALVPPLLPGGFRVINGLGQTERSGFAVRIFLPTGTGQAVGGEAPSDTYTGDVYSDLAETIWCARSWPIQVGPTGTRTFFVGQTDDLISNVEAVFSGATLPDRVDETSAGTASVDDDGSDTPLTGIPALRGS